MERFDFSSLQVSVLGIDEMMNVRGGEGPVTPPPPVKKGEESDIIL